MPEILNGSLVEMEIWLAVDWLFALEESMGNIEGNLKSRGRILFSNVKKRNFTRWMVWEKNLEQME